MLPIATAGSVTPSRPHASEGARARGDAVTLTDRHRDGVNGRSIGRGRLPRGPICSIDAPRRTEGWQDSSSCWRCRRGTM